MKKIERDADPNNLVKNRLDWPLTTIERQFCYQLEHRLMFEKRTRRSIENIILDERYTNSPSNDEYNNNNHRNLAEAEDNKSNGNNNDVSPSSMRTKNITRLHVYPRFGETLPTHSDFFNKYSSKSIPIIFEELGKRMVQDKTLLERCLEGKNSGMNANDILENSLDSLPIISLPTHCPAFLKSIYKIPDFMSVDLFQSSVFRNEDGEYADERLNNHWPIVHQNLKKGDTQTLRATTLGAHNVLLVLHGKIQIKLYRKEHHPYLLPKYNNENTSKGIHEEDFTYNVMPRFQDHDEVQQGIGNSNIVIMDDSIPCYQDVLVENESIYIPSGYIYTFKVLDDNNGVASVLSHEFLDASSLNVHKEEARIKLLKLGWDHYHPDGALLNDTDIRRFVKYFNALQLLHTDAVSIQQSHGSSLMSWDIYKSFPRPEPPQSKNRRERYKRWQGKRTWQQNLLHYTGPSPKNITINTLAQESVEVIVKLKDELPKKYFSEVVIGFQINGFTTLDFSPTRIFPKTLQEEMDMKRDFLQQQQGNEGLSRHSDIFHTRYVMKTDKEIMQDLGNNTFNLKIDNLTPNQMYALRFTVLTNYSIGERSKTIIFRTLDYTNPQQLDPPELCENNTHSLFAGLTVKNCLIVKLPIVDPNTLLPIEAVAVKWERVDGAYKFMYEPIIFKINYEQLGQGASAAKYHFVKLNVENKIPGAQYVYKVAAYNSKGGYGKYSIGSKIVNSAKRNTTGMKQLPATVYGVRHAFKKSHGFIDSRGPRLGPSCMIYAEKQVLTMSINFVEEFDDDLEAYTGMLNQDYPEHHVRLWRSHFSPMYDIFGELVVGDPIHGDYPFFNGEKIKGRIVIVERGVVPFVTKVRNAIHAGALGIIIRDNWHCNEDKDQWTHSQKCIVGSVYDNGDGWGQHDNPEAWAQAYIPTYFVTSMSGLNLTKIVDRWEKHFDRDSLELSSNSLI
eukprot:g7956.t1